MGDNRQSKRTPVELGASFGVDGSDLDENAQVKNISGQGFCFQSQKQIADGTDINLVVELSDSDKISINVKVIWSKENENQEGYLIGVQIIDSPSEEIEKFLDFYNNQLED